MFYSIIQASCELHLCVHPMESSPCHGSNPDTRPSFSIVLSERLKVSTNIQCDLKTTPKPQSLQIDKTEAVELMIQISCFNNLKIYIQIFEVRDKHFIKENVSSSSEAFDKILKNTHYKLCIDFITESMQSISTHILRTLLPHHP